MTAAGGLCSTRFDSTPCMQSRVPLALRLQVVCMFLLLPSNLDSVKNGFVMTPFLMV